MHKMKIGIPKGFHRVDPIYWEVGETEKWYAGEQIWSGDGIKIEDDKAYRYSFWESKLVACNSAKQGEVVVCVPINYETKIT